MGQIDNEPNNPINALSGLPLKDWTKRLPRYPYRIHRRILKYYKAKIKPARMGKVLPCCLLCAITKLDFGYWQRAC